MKPFTKIFLSVVLTALCLLCVVLLLLSNNSVCLVIYNPITNTTLQKKVDRGSVITEHLEAEHLAGYTFLDYYYSSDFLKPVELDSKITQNATIVLGYTKNITSISQATNNVVGISYSGVLSDEDFNILNNKSYKYLDLSTAEFSGTFKENNTSLQTIILPSGTIENLNNFSNLKSVYISGNTQVINSFNNCAKLSVLNLEGCLNITNSFNNCSELKSLEIPSSLQTMSNSFVGTQLEYIKNNNANFLLENGVLYLLENDAVRAIKAVSTVDTIEFNKDTTSISDYAFYKHPKIKTVILNSKIDSIGSHAFADSKIEDINIIQNTVLTIKEKAFSNCQNLTTVNFGKGIENIESFAFYNTNIEELNFENSVISNIYEYAFAECDNLKTVKFLEKQITLNQGVFSGCEELISVSNLNIQELPQKVFENCVKLTNLTNFSSLNNIGNYAFLNCKNLKDITELASIKTVGIGAFQNCVNLIQAKFLNLENLSENLFLNCSNLEEFVSAQNLIQFNATAFDGCLNLKNLSFVSDLFVIENGVVYTKDLTKLLFYLPTKKDDTFTIKGAVESINSKYLAQNLYLQKIQSESASFYAEDGVLFSANQEQLICYPSGKTESVYIVPNSVKTLLKYSFVNTPNLKQLTISDSVEQIENGFLWQNSGLTTLNTSFIGESINNLYSGFLGWFFGAVEYYQNSQFIPETLKEIIVNNQSFFVNNCFYDCTSLSSVKISNSGKIVAHMFYGCYSLQTIVVNQALESIGEYAFYNCLSLISISFVYNSNLTSKDVDLSALLKTPRDVKVTLYNSIQITPTQLTNFSACFRDKQYEWAWKTSIIK